MSEEQLKAFLEKVKGDTSLQEKLKAAAAPEAAADSDAVLAIAKEAGFSISADDLKNAQSEISEEELEGVAGGKPGMTLEWAVVGCVAFVAGRWLAEN
jgi:predicted ribosomally synthesized peptide with nif11-like leader